RIVGRWQRDLDKLDMGLKITLPDQKFRRHQGVYADHNFSPEGELITEEEFNSHRDEWLPTDADREHVSSCMVQVHEVGKIANWISPPNRGVNDNPFEFEYVKLS
ncbi:MAG: benzoyl-CoA 2,3-epoxidase subunit BoxB, partial [Planctomycetota bacterium]|nr:benzoyl-CoA 2,3-epoxidase subunit BoxB [Planctomycetota bacterium]